MWLKSYTGPYTEKTVSLNQRNISLIYGRRKNFFEIKSFVNSNKFSMIQKNRFLNIKENFFKSIKLSSIQRNLFFDRISEKLFSGCRGLNLIDILYN